MGAEFPLGQRLSGLSDSRTFRRFSNQAAQVKRRTLFKMSQKCIPYMSAASFANLLTRCRKMHWFWCFKQNQLERTCTGSLLNCRKRSLLHFTSARDLYAGRILRTTSKDCNRNHDKIFKSKRNLWKVKSNEHNLLQSASKLRARSLCKLNYFFYVPFVDSCGNRSPKRGVIQFRWR